MIRIDKHNCVGCGACQFVRFTLPLVKEDEHAFYYEDPRAEDEHYVENAIAECWGQAISIQR